MRRLEPQFDGGRRIDGHVASYEEVPDQDSIMYEHGGHLYRLRVQWGTKYVGHATFEIGYPPRVEVPRPAPPTDPRSRIIRFVP
ncbi:MAG: hypothetical protein O7H41_02985 [Planctomycetota bacterium]|nr:hypothetical protein [Planctomycetota bacterium]